MELRTDPRVKDVFDSYPELARDRLNHLRDLILATASEIDGIGTLEETLKWGEPSYLAKHSSTIRIDWKEKSPDQYAIYFKCTSKLVPTFKIIHKNKFNYEGNRAIVFSLDDKIPEAALKQCIGMALTYHKVKQLPLLGA
ncbi:MAG: DUF1801 domain-containing protein [Bacteroidia bacterium]|nr:DUF1801 domain-containing protein [Bacteroidia bacterium]NNF32393.1 DUF1801 domain-containing protein [Flavobacteriaceae bacterium]NNJ83170.1 DUF1801 domain-containing protein [Flavobacteriaceae bacterium]NNK55433.1 DUF1801 domain-containing protein [Flavobacteriaceae bacterium]